jgi:hypothetical protein
MVNMENDPRKRRKLSDHALELIMRDVLHGLQDMSLDLQADAATATASTEDSSLTSGSIESALGGDKK